jgi:2-keto-4-pentenoate hydratase/2-oxohepta-3-ene-1,7-dioic acid hydratase in catechol pathway
VRFGQPGSERPGILAKDGLIRDLSGVVDDLSGTTLCAKQFAKLSELNLEELPLAPKGARLGVPVAGTRNFVGVGLNYRDHAIAIGSPIPEEPIIFLKSLNALQGPDDPVVLPLHSVKSDWEVELGVVISEHARCVSEAQAMQHVAGYCVVNDLSERAFQLERGGTWIKGKSCDTFGPVGPWLVTKDEVPDPQSLGVWLSVNGQPMQRGSTRDMIFSVAFLVSYISHFFTLFPGDIISTGTPDGVGMTMKPSSVYLKPGDVMTLGVEGLGEQRQVVKAWSSEA